MLKTLIAAAVLAATPVAPALADHGGPTVTVELGVYGANDRDRGWDHDHDWNGVSRREAIRIAFGYGMREAYDVDRRGGVWIVKGESWRGGRMTVEISARSGRVLDVDYGRSRRRGWDDDWRW